MAALRTDAGPARRPSSMPSAAVGRADLGMRPSSVSRARAAERLVGERCARRRRPAEPPSRRPGPGLADTLLLRAQLTRPASVLAPPGVHDEQLVEVGRGARALVQRGPVAVRVLPCRLTLITAYLRSRARQGDRLIEAARGQGAGQAGQVRAGRGRRGAGRGWRGGRSRRGRARQRRRAAGAARTRRSPGPSRNRMQDDAATIAGGERLAEHAEPQGDRAAGVHVGDHRGPGRACSAISWKNRTNARA